MFTPQRNQVHVQRAPSAILSLHPLPYLGTDFEGDIRTGQPTVIGVSDGTRTVSVPYDEGKPYFQELLTRFPEAQIVGHNICGYDLDLCRREGLPVREDLAQDTILWHWLTNMNLSKAGAKTDDGEGERKGRGFNSIWFPVSQYTNAQNWKTCIGDRCEGSGRSCPQHNVFQYNGEDAYWPVVALPHMLRRAKLMGVDRLYPLHRDLAGVLNGMRERGLLIDTAYVERLNQELVDAGDQLRARLPFNPDSPKQVLAHFKAKGIHLENAQQATIDAACEEYEDDDLDILQTYGQLGNGVDRWFKRQTWNEEKGNWDGYVDDAGLIHAYLAFFTSTARLRCGSPNLQNIAHRPKRWEKGLPPEQILANRIRRAVIAPEGHWLIEADYSNAENRVILHQAGHAVPDGVDLHTWVAEIAGFQPDDPFSLREGSPRAAAKTVQHGNFYLEGLSLISREQLRSQYIQNEVAKGVRVVYPDWTFNGQIVTFTGKNFAQRAFGSASHENRKKANDIIGRLFSRFPGVRDLQRRKSKEIERERCIRNEFGYCLPLYDKDPEKMKTGLAFTGSNPIAHLTKLAMLRADQHPHLDCRLQVHDSLIFVVDRRHDLKQVKAWVREVMEIPLPELGGLRIPVDVKHGPDWSSLIKI